MNGGENEEVTSTDGAGDGGEGGETTKKKKGKKKKNTDENLHDISKLSSIINFDNGELICEVLLLSSCDCEMILRIQKFTRTKYY